MKVAEIDPTALSIKLQVLRLIVGKTKQIREKNAIMLKKICIASAIPIAMGLGSMKMSVAELEGGKMDRYVTGSDAVGLTMGHYAN